MQRDPASTNCFIFETVVTTRSYFLLFCSLLFMLTGCSVIHVYDGGVLVSRKFGLPVYQINAQPERALFISTTGFGVLSGVDGLTLGYARQVYAAVAPGQCSVVFFVESSWQAQQRLQTLKNYHIDLNKICIAQAGDADE